MHCIVFFKCHISNMTLTSGWRNVTIRVTLLYNQSVKCGGNDDFIYWILILQNANPLSLSLQLYVPIFLKCLKIGYYRYHSDFREKVSKRLRRSYILLSWSQQPTVNIRMYDSGPKGQGKICQNLTIFKNSFSIPSHIYI